LSLSFGALHDRVGKGVEVSQEVCRVIEQVEKANDFEVDAKAGRYIEDSSVIQN